MCTSLACASCPTAATHHHSVDLRMNKANPLMAGYSGHYGCCARQHATESGLGQLLHQLRHNWSGRAYLPDAMLLKTAGVRCVPQGESCFAAKCLLPAVARHVNLEVGAVVCRTTGRPLQRYIKQQKRCVRRKCYGAAAAKTTNVDVGLEKQHLNQERSHIAYIHLASKQRLSPRARPMSATPLDNQPWPFRPWVQ